MRMLSIKQNGTSGSYWFIFTLKITAVQKGFAGIACARLDLLTMLMKT